VAVSGDNTYSSPTFTATEVGTYLFTAIYSSDSNNVSVQDNGANESVAVSQATPAITTQASAGGVVGIAVIGDSATLSGGNNPGGNIDFQVTYPDLTTQDLGTVAVSGDNTYSSPTFTATEAGTYTFTAIYSGDTNNVSVQDNGANEAVAVSQASPAISTQASETAGGVVGVSVLGDTATLTGGYSPTGNIDFTVKLPDGTTQDLGTVAVSGDNTYSSPTFTATEVGTYKFSASYTLALLWLIPKP
jgi:hypothetical protein